ncbi:hypothetical protein LAZ67_10002104 [Cordylochernes scorpioides]|uniref:Reverse transcriptase domain-containing protein n=1 Tax=Cordylochernes scorpioides TaxID=51811 RepID=A0ABY6KWD0_9ARAC|nr:hypothetical protein LAZ67_10002104 [Cordylochernes scorpioides]
MAHFPKYSDPNMGTMKRLPKITLSQRLAILKNLQRKLRYSTVPISSDAAKSSIILVFGGLDPRDPENLDIALADLTWRSVAGTTVFMYLIQEARWVDLGQMPEPRNYHTACYLRGRVYIAGGYDPTDVRGQLMLPTCTTFQFSLRTRRWRKMMDMSHNRACHGAAVLDESMIVLGGIDTHGKLMLTVCCSILSSVEIYHPEANQWNFLRTMMLPLMGMGVAVLDDSIWVIGGLTDLRQYSTNSPLTDIVLCYEPIQNCWYKKCPLPSPRAYTAAITLRREVWAWGGVVDGPEVLDAPESIDNAEVYNPIKCAWVTPFCLTTPKHSIAMAKSATKGLKYKSKKASTKEKVSTMAVNVNKLEKFSGDKGSIRPESWLKLYELETGKLDEVDRINNLIYYLSKDALEWFADEILSNASIKKWDTVKLKLIQRFGYKVESPIVAASKRRLKKEETVEDYFRDKIRLLNQTSLNNVEKLKMLTDGLPLDWKNYLVTAQPKDPSHWMQIAMEIEQNNNQIRQQQRSKTKVFNITTPTISKNCPYWCPICRKKGLYFKHWISDCKDYDPNYKDKLKHQATNITTDVKQTIADSLCIANTNFPYRFVNVEVLLNNIPVSSFIDTGSTISLMSCSLLKQHKLKLNVNDRIKIKQVDSFAYTLGSVEVFLKIHSKLVGCKLHVVKNFSYPLLIRLDVAGKIGLIIDTKDKAVYVKGNECFYISPETHLPSVQQKELNQLLKENQALFSQHETDIGRIAVQHKIHTIEHPPISCRPYRRPLAEYDEIKRQVEELSKKGLIRESQSPWAFPVMLVSKKDGSQRMCIDYRKLNAITIDDKQPLPYIQDMFDRLHNAKYFTTLDIAWGYWHVEIHPDSVEKTAFITNDGHYEFLVMPFGLKNAPSTFQRIIQHIIGNLLWNGVCNYQDDILIYSSTFKDHIELMKKIFDKLKENNIKLKLKKCSFAKQEIRYLGHIIGHNKIKPDPEKTKAINEFPQPKTVKQVRQFLGLAGYYRKFIPKFSEIADPLTSLTRKNKLFKWTTEVNKSFQELKSHLSTDPVLSTYDPSLPCKLYTDASKLGIGAILARIGNDNQEHVISYYSGKLLPHQQNYSAFELECFAVVQSVEYFEVYLENNTFEVITDHSALEWLFNVKKPKVKYLRWIIELSTKSMKIVHRSGSKQTHVDALSRSPVSFHISIPTLRLHQQKADLSFVKNSHIHRDLIMVKHNGVLKTVVPESFQEEIFSKNTTIIILTPQLTRQ